MNRGELFRSALLVSLVIAAGTLAFPVRSSAQTRQFLGPVKCTTGCHDHDDEKEWSEKRDGDGKGKQHVNALNQLADKKAIEYAKALNVDRYDVKSTCVTCHATVVRRSADYGVTCETCHGAGQDYLKPHQEKGAYQKSLALGLKDKWKKPEAWVRDCLSCHVLGSNPGDDALIKAGHSSGDDFDLGVKFVPVSGHWSSKYTANQVAALARPVRTELLAKRPAAPPQPGPASPRPSVPTPPPAVVDAPSPAPPVAALPDPAPVSGAAPPIPAVVPPSSTPPVSTSPVPVLPAPARPQVMPPAVPALPPPLPAPPAAPVPVVLDDVPLTPAGLVGSVQGRLAALLSDLLERGVRVPKPVTPPAPSTAYRGADADLLRLQEEIISLAIEVLGVAPPAPRAPAP